MASLLEEDNYTIAWIAVLPIEAEAALGVLDKKHDGDFESSYGHDYIYIGGEINGHNIVIATLQAGQNYGVGSAAALVAQLKIRFTNIWFALLVGVAAGIPNLTPIDPTKRRDIRLGDVLVCTPEKTRSGIVQYDLGTITSEGFTLSGRHAETHPIVRGAISKIQLTKKRPFKKGNDFARYLEALQRQDEDQTFECPSQDRDQYLVGSVGISPPSMPAERTRRDETERTRVWYGIIGSGNSLVRSAQRRDELRDRYDLIGLEMEAAGVMNVIPAGIIKGVCDYADQYKTKDWQAYAAAVAAVYAKGVLSVIRPKVGNDNRVVVSTAKPKINMAPLENPDFVGRELVLREIEGALETRHKVALVGLGGIGKSEIAAAYCYRQIKATESISIFWVHGDTASAFIASYQRIAEALGLKTERSSDLVTMQLVVESLKQNQYDKWLMVIDNADDYAVFAEVPQVTLGIDADTEQQLPKPLQNYIPTSPNGRVLITSRVRNAAQSLAGYQISVSSLTLVESEALMKIKLREKSPNDETVHQLAKQLEYLPLAITQACACIMIQMPAKKYLSFLQKGEQHQMKLLRKSVIDIRRREGRPDEQSPNDSVIQTWFTSLTQMEIMGSPKAIEVVCFISHFHRHAVPETLIIEAFGEEEAEDHLAILNDFGLITRRSDPEAVDMHRFTQLTAWAWLEQDDRLTKSQALALTTINRVLETSYDNNDRSMGRLLAPHAEEIRKRQFPPSQQLQLGVVNLWLGLHLMERSQQARAAELLALSSEIFEREECDDVSMVIRSTAGHVETLLELGRYKEAEKIVLETMYDIDEQLKRIKATSNEHLSETWQTLDAWCKVLFGRVLWHKGEWLKAETLFREALQVRRRYLKAHHEAMIAIMALLTIVLRCQCKYVQSLAMIEEALGQAIEAYGHDHERVYECYNQLGLCLFKLQRHDEAETALRKALTGRMSLLPEHIYTVTWKHSLTTILHGSAKIGDLEALKEVEEQLKSVRGLVEDDHPTTILMGLSRAVLLKQCGRTDEAHTEFTKVLDQREQLLGTYHPDTISALIEVAVSHRGLNRHEKARDLAREAYEMSKSVMGECHEKTVLIGCVLAWEIARENPSQGELLLLAMLRQCEEDLDPDDERIRDATWGIILLYEQTDRSQLAIPHMENIYNRDGSGTTPVRALQSQSELAKLLRETGNHSAADLHYSQVVQNYTSYQGVESSTLYSYAYDIALELHEAGRYVEAKTVVLDLILKQSAILGEHHRRVLTSQSLLALVLRAHEEYDAAEVLNQEVLNSRRKLFGEADPQVYQSLNNLALVLCDRKQFDDAVRMIYDSYEGYQRVLGATQGDTLLAMHNIAFIYKSAEDFPKALIACSQAREARERVLGPQDRKTLETLRLQMETLQDSGDYSGILEMRGDIVERHARKFGDNHRLTFLVLRIAGRASLAIGDVRAAEIDLRRVFDGCLQNLREDLLQKRSAKFCWKMAYFGLTQIYQNEKRFQELLLVTHDTMDIEKSAHGPGSSEMAHLHAVMGVALQGLERYTEAVDQYEASAIIAETSNVFSTDRYIYTVRMYTNGLVDEGYIRPQSEALLLRWRAVILVKEDQTALDALLDIARCFQNVLNQHAEETYKQILGLIVMLEGAGARREWEIKSELALTYFASGRYKEATTLFQQVIQALDEHSGIDSLASIQRTSNLTMSDLYIGQLSDVEEKMRWVVSKRQEFEGIASPGFVVAQSLLGMILLIKDDLPESIKYFRAVLESRTARDGNIPTKDVVRAQYWLSWALMENAELEEAEHLAEAAYKGRVSIPTLGSNHRDTLVARALWARIRHLKATTIQVLHEVENDLTAVIETQLIRQGGNHPFTLLSMQYLALVQAAQSDYIAALTTVQSAIEKFKKSDNTTHPFVPSTLELLARMYAVTGETERAEAAYVKTVQCSRLVFGGIEKHRQAMSAVGGAVLFLVRRWMAAQREQSQKSHSDSDHLQKGKSLTLLSASSSWEVGADIW